MRPVTSLPLLQKWILAHTLAVAAASAITFGLAATFFDLLSENVLVVLAVSGAISGLCIGAAEAWVLRSLLTKQAIGWVLAMMVATPLGVVGSGLLFVIMEKSPAFDLFEPEFIGGGVFGLGVGIIVGLAQWVFFRRVFRHAWIWIAAVIAGRVIGWSASTALISQLTADVYLENLFLPAGLGGAIGGTIYGAIAGICLLWLVAHCQRGDKLQPQEREESDVSCENRPVD